MRFVQLDPAYLRKTIDDLRQYYLNPIRHPRKRQQAQARYEPLRAMFFVENPGTLSSFNCRLSHFLLRAVGLEPKSVVLSDLLDDGLLVPDVNRVLNHLDDIVQVFNATITELLKQEIDPQVRPLPDDYLPLHYACPLDNRRLKLCHQIQGDDHYAVATCKCGEAYRFYLGHHTLSVVELTSTRRWSLDVMLPLFLNQTTSGYVGGKSSAIYFGLVMGPVLERVLGLLRIPILVPLELASPEAAADVPDSLLYEYLHVG
jgi:hypothetical protein